MAKKLWGGRFDKKTDPLVEEFTSSISYDKSLALYDIKGSIAHAKMLGKCNIITKKESALLVKGLRSIEKKIDKINIDKKAEDIHTAITNLLHKEVGKVADKLHTARSRNDQVVLDVKMYCKDAVDDLANLIMSLQKSIIKFADKNSQIIIPAYTHLQTTGHRAIVQYPPQDREIFQGCLILRVWPYYLIGASYCLLYGDARLA